MSTELKKLAWSIERRLFAHSNIQLFELATNIATDNGDPVWFKQTDDESCMDYVTAYIQSDTLLQLEDEGLSQLLMLDDGIDQLIKKSYPAELSVSELAEQETLATPSPHPSNMISGSPPSSDNALVTNVRDNMETQSIAELKRVYEELMEQLQGSRTHCTQERPVTIKDLSYLPRRELFGEQIGPTQTFYMTQRLYKKSSFT